MKEYDFWDIDSLLPHRPAARHAPSPSPRPLHPEKLTSEISDGTSVNRSVSISDILKASLPPINESFLDYSPKSNIVQNAVISDFHGSYSYSNDFSKGAHGIHSRTPSGSADFVPFFSYMPQYSDLNEMQYKRYLWWRECVRKGEYLKTDTSYIYLYIYEIIALDDVISPENSLRMIIDLWGAYRNNHPELDKHLGDWIVDYALIHDMPIPFERLEKVLLQVRTKQQSILFNMYLFDYLFADKTRLNRENILLICELLSNYSPFKGKNYAIEEYKKIFDQIIEPIFEKLFDIGFFSIDGSYIHRSELKVTRPSYLSAVCSAHTKKNLTITYYPCISNELIRTSFSNILKHTENKIRAALGMRNRLSNIVLPDEIRQVIDSYMAQHYPAIPRIKSQSVQKEAAPAEIKKVKVNVTRAKQIEDLSWQTTEKLTEGLEIEEVIIHEHAAEPNMSEEISKNSLEAILTDEEAMILKLLLKNVGAAEADEVARQNGIMLDAAINSINEKALEVIGDTVINTANYTIIEDYIDELAFFNQA